MREEEGFSGNCLIVVMRCSRIKAAADSEGLTYFGPTSLLRGFAHAALLACFRFRRCTLGVTGSLVAARMIIGE